MPRYDPKTCLLVVDVQNDFADPKGSLYVQGAQDIIPLLNEEIGKAIEAGALVLYTQDWHPPSTPHFQKDGGVWPVHCVWEEWGSQFHPSLAVEGDSIKKGAGGEDGYSAFTVRDPESGKTTATLLERLLRERGIERLVIGGLATDYCVKETALDARRVGFETVVLRDAVRAVDLKPGDGERAIEEIQRAGAELA